MFSSSRRREAFELSRLEHLVAAARLGTAWLQGDAAGPVAPDGAFGGPRHDDGDGFRRCTSEHCHD